MHFVRQQRRMRAGSGKGKRERRATRLAGLLPERGHAQRPWRIAELPSRRSILEKTARVSLVELSMVDLLSQRMLALGLGKAGRQRAWAAKDAWHDWDDLAEGA